jgi:nucleotide-binding universal stress UspA family protein
MKKILVPCDFSKPAINAFRLALDVAQQSKGIVHLLHVIELPILHDTLLMPVLNFEEQLLKELKEKAESRFKKIIEKYNSANTKIVSDVRFGAVSRMLLDYANENRVDVILMGSHGATGLREVFVGSNAEKIVRQSPVPVIVLKNYFKGSIKNIVFPNTLETEHQEDLLMKVKALQNFFKAKLHIVWINTPINFTSDKHTYQRMETFAKRFMLKDYTIHIFNHVDEEQGILDFTRRISGDMIAIGTHGRKGLSHLINGSLAEDLANHSDSLIWTYSLQNEPVAEEA